MRKQLFTSCLLLGILLGCTYWSLAQVPTGSISGTVRDASGAVISGATVTATNRETGLTRTVQSGGDGHYKFPVLPVGVYDVKSEAAGFQTQVQQNLSLSVGQEPVLNFSLPVGAVQESVTVSAAAPLVETTSGSLGGLVNEAKVADLPLNGRSFNQLVLLQSGITVHRPVSSTSTTSIGLAFSSNGAPIRSNFITVDGANMASSSGITGVSISGTMLGVDAVREFRVITNFFPAEYGMTMGSQMIIVSKGGSNAFHGTAFEFLRNSALDARNFFERQKSPFRHNNFGGSFGGPIQRDKTFFFLNYEGVRESKGVPQLLNVPNQLARTNGGLVPQIDPRVLPYLALYPLPNGVLANDPTGRNGVGTHSYSFKQPTSENFGQVRVDHTFSESNQFFARYTIDDTSQVAPATGFPDFFSDRISRGQFATIAENHTFSPSVLNTARLSWSRPFQTFLSPSPVELSFLPGTGFGMGTISISGSGITTLGPSATHPLEFHQNEFTLSDDISWVKDKHSFKFGTLMNRYRDAIAANNTRRGQMQFSSLANFLQANPNQLQVMFAGAVSDRTIVWNTFGFYAQDDWRILPRLTLNLGLRYEFNSELHEVTGRGSSVRHIESDTTATIGPALYKNNSLENFGPRVGFAWDVTGNGRTALRGGFGIFYDIANITSSVDIETTGTPPFSGTVILAPPALRFPGNTLPGPNAGPLALRTILYDQSQPHLISYNLTLERQLPGSMAFSATYAGSRGISLPGTIEGVPAIPQGQPGLINGVPGCVPLATARTFLGGPEPHCWLGNERRINPAFNSCECKSNGMDSWYNSLQIGLRKRMSHSLEFQASYTFAKHLDTTQGQHGGEAGGSNTTGTDPGRLKTDRGRSDFNIPHYFVFNTLFTLPSPNVSGVAGALVKGWKMSTIFTAENGLPFTAYLSAQRSRSGILGGGSGNPDRPDLVAGCERINGGPNQYFNPSCFRVQPAGFLGTEGRNILIGPKTVNWDFSLRKDTPIPALGETGKLEFRAEFFNFLNHANFGIPTNGRTVFNATATAANTTPLATAGQISRTVTDARQIQFALKLIF